MAWVHLISRTDGQSFQVMEPASYARNRAALDRNYRRVTAAEFRAFQLRSASSSRAPGANSAEPLAARLQRLEGRIAALADTPKPAPRAAAAAPVRAAAPKLPATLSEALSRDVSNATLRAMQDRGLIPRSLRDCDLYPAADIRELQRRGLLPG